MQSGWFSGLSDLPIPFIGIFTFASLALGSLVAQALRRRKSKRPARGTSETNASIAQESFLIGSVLATLGLLLGFSFNMVINRYEARRQLVVMEANAIGTSYLRSQLLDEPYRSRLSNLLVQYTINKIRQGSLSENADNPYLETNNRLLTEIWVTVKQARESALSHGLTTAVLTTFNQIIDLDAERREARELRFPPEVLLLLFSYLAITAGVIGYQIDGPRARRAALTQFVLMALSLTIISDINRPFSGQSWESQKPLELLLKSLKSQPPQVFDEATAVPEVGN